MILVTYGILWQIIDFEVKRLEPFYQLSQPTGASAAEFLNMVNFGFWSYLVPFKAFRSRQLAVFLCSSATLFASTLGPVFQSAAINIPPAQTLRVADEPEFVRIDPVWSRLMEAALIMAALSGILLLFQLLCKSGLLSDPKGIADSAAMATRSHILNDFKGLDTAKHNIIHKLLAHRRYILHKGSLLEGEYLRHNISEEEPHKPENSFMLRLKAGIPYVAYMLTFMVLIPLFMFTNANVVTEKLPWLLTAIATTVKLIRNTRQFDIRMIEPFYIRSVRHAPPRSLTLDYTGTIPGWMTIRALLNKHYLVSLAGFGAILTELFIVCVSSFNVNGRTFAASTSASALRRHCRRPLQHHRNLPISLGISRPLFRHPPAPLLHRIPDLPLPAPRVPPLPARYCPPSCLHPPEHDAV